MHYIPVTDRNSQRWVSFWSPFNSENALSNLDWHSTIPLILSYSKSSLKAYPGTHVKYTALVPDLIQCHHLVPFHSVLHWLHALTQHFPQYSALNQHHWFLFLFLPPPDRTWAGHMGVEDHCWQDLSQDHLWIQDSSHWLPQHNLVVYCCHLICENKKLNY